jgi:GT2 family glycosyltransferase
MSNPLVSILTVQYNHIEQTIQFLESISQIEYDNYEVIVVDNASEVDASKEIKMVMPDARVIRSEMNLGFAGGNNLGLPFCKGELILFINNDTEVERDFLRPLVQLWKSIPKIGMISPRIQYYDPKGVLQYAGATELSRFTLRNRSLGFRDVDKGQFLDTYKTGFIHGAAMLVPSSVIREAGEMESGFFLYYEEYDWCSRIKALEYEIYYCGESLIYHKESMSVGKVSALKTYYRTRNRIWFAKRNLKGVSKPLTLFYLYVLALPKQLLLTLFQKRWDLFQAAWRGAFFKPSLYENRNRSTTNL